METKLVKVNVNTPEPEKIEEAAAIIRNGGLVAFPTETVYGLGADGLQAEGSKKIYAAKGRPSDNPLIIHIAEFDALKKIVSEIPPAAHALADAFWPGPLTMIFPKSDIVPYETTGGLDTVAVRFPSHPVARELILKGGGYIAAPSANTSGRPSPTLAEHVYEDMNGRIPMILDGGAVGIGIESSIIDLSVDPPMILRPGYITQEMMEKVIGDVKMDPGLSGLDPNLRPKAPGMKYRHYAPKADLKLVEGEADAVIAKIKSLMNEAVAEGKKVGIIGTDETVGIYKEFADSLACIDAKDDSKVASRVIIKSIGSRDDEDSIAHNLFAILREFDASDAELIYSESFATPRIGAAIMNRLLKSAGHQVIEA